MADTSTTSLRRSPLQHLADELAAASTDTVSVREVPYRAMVALRCSPDGDAATRVADELGASLPIECGGVGGRDTQAIWMGPDEWLVVSDEAPDDLVARLETALGDASGAVVDVSSNRTTVELSGPQARHLLDKGCSLDLHPRVFEVGRSLPTDVTGVQVVLRRVDDTTWHVLPRSSFAEHLVRWVLVNVQEYSAPGRS